MTGDEVIVTKEYLGNLIKRPNAIDGTLRSLTIDARRIILRGPLAFADADVKLLAHEVEFEPGGVITLIPSPAKPLTIAADSVTFPSSTFRHFDVRFRTKGDTFTDIAAILVLNARDVRVSTTSIPSSDVVANLAKRFTLQQLFDFTPKISAQTGASGLAEWRKAMAASEWPSYAVAVWRSGFRIAPFDSGYTQALGKMLDRYSSLLTGVVSAKVLFEIDSMRNAIAAGVDIDGNGPAYAPVIPLSQLKRRLQSYTTSSSAIAGDRLKILDVLRDIVKAAHDQVPPNTALLLADSSARVKELTSEQRRAQSRLADIAAEIASTQQLLQQATDAYKAREAGLIQHAKDIERGAQSRQQLVAGVATAVSIVATAYSGNPQVGALAGGLVIAIGANGNGKNTVESLSAGYQFYDSVKTPLADSKAALENLDAARRQYSSFVDSFTLSNITIKEFIEIQVPGPPPSVKKITRDQALSDLGAKGNAVANSALGLIDVYKKFSPSPAQMPAVEEDNDLKNLASEITVGLEKVKELTLELEALQRTSAEHDQQLVAEAERCARLTTLAVTNEEERRAVLNLALSLVRDELTDLANTIAEIRKVSLVEYRSELPVDAEEIRRLFVAAEIWKSFDPSSSLDEKAVLEQYTEFVAKTRTYVELLADRIDRALDREFADYVSRRGTGPALSYPSHTFKRTWFSTTEDAEFLRRINRNLAQQFAARGDATALRGLSEQRIPIPFDIRDKLTAAYPTRFIQAALVGATAQRFGTANDMTFTVELARVGNFRQRGSGVSRVTAPPGQECGCRPDEECYSVDYRAKESSPDQYFWWRDFSLADIRNQQTLLRTPDLSFWFLDPTDASSTTGRTAFVSFPAAEAELFLRVRLDSRTRRVKTPIINSLTLKLEVFQ